jgi:hypothetical protein
MDIFCRGIRPFPPLALSEVCFWLRIMRDHSQFIELGLPCDAEELKAEAKCFFNIFTELEERAGRVGCFEDFSRLVEATMTAVHKFLVYKRCVLHLLIECRLCGGCLQPLFVDHLSREANYFLKLLAKCRTGEMACRVDAVVSENVFWTRITADHFRFTRDLLDPAERKLAAEAAAFGDKFDQLGLKARDVASMLWHYMPTNELIRFEKDIRCEAEAAKQFAAAAEGLVCRCAAASVISPLLAGHICRETDHFLGVLECIRQYLLNGDAPQDDQSAG